MSMNRAHTITAHDTTRPGDEAATYSLTFEVFRTTTFVIIRDEHGRTVAHLDITSADWNQLARFTGNVRQADQAEADSERR